MECHPRQTVVDTIGRHSGVCEHGNATGLLKWTRNDLINEAIKRERDHIHKLLPTSLDRHVMERGAALLTLAGHQEQYDQDWLEFLHEDATAIGYQNTEPGMISQTLRDIFGEEEREKGKALSPISPDILGEAFAMCILSENVGALADTLIRLFDFAGIRAWARLLRAKIDLYETEDLQVADEWIIPLLQKRSTSELLGISFLIPLRTVALRKLALESSEILLSRLREDPEADEERARILNNVGNRYSELGHREKALEAAKRAVEIRERLAERATRMPLSLTWP